VGGGDAGGDADLAGHGVQIGEEHQEPEGEENRAYNRFEASGDACFAVMVASCGPISWPHSENTDLAKGAHQGFGGNHRFTGEWRLREGEWRLKTLGLGIW
jgi:hypothetical protein